MFQEIGKAKQAKDKVYGKYYNTTDITVAWRLYYSKKMTDTRYRDSFNQEIIYTYYIYTIPDPEKTDYTPDDLQKDSILLERALRMLQRYRFRIDKCSQRIVPYIDYTFLDGGYGTDVIDRVVKKELSEAESADIMQMFGIGKWAREPEVAAAKETAAVNQAPIRPATAASTA
ncbi:hypothetical protein TI39_contig856g00004 [Zymoseptoria brevis]|uniref:Uncharacterized protein n=1 Tax=Zymoseptoria brevis TaxID=1047168 RepID=A0A0F4GEU8_9PEZI|nr:hypothetical protein TI39_contig856g00004 [Zymoseptoria brevis]